MKSSYPLTDQRKNIIVIVFFLVYLIAGLSIVGDYGVSMDEGNNRIDGFKNINYIIHKDPKILNYSNKYHGPLFSVVANMTEIVFGYSDDPGTIFFVRHLLTFLIFFLSIVCFYKLLYFCFKNWQISLLGCFFLIITPRIFAHSFYNPKDSVFLSVCIFAVYSQYIFLKEPTPKSALTHGFFCALAIATRIMGLFIPVVTLIAHLLTSRDEKFPAKKSLFFILATFFFTYLFWPVLWVNPFAEFKNALFFTSKIPVESVVLYRGSLLASQQLPWHYVPVWMAVTTPISFLILFVVGFFTGIRKLFRERLHDNLMGFLVFCWLAIPLLTFIVLRPSLYSGFRHFMFIYPAFLIIVIEGLHSLILFFTNYKNAMLWRFVYLSLLALVTINCMTTLIFMIKNHPFQNVYFNSLAGENFVDIKDKFEMDYWGLSFRRGFEHLIHNIHDEQINIIVADDTYLLGSSFLSDKERARFKLCTGGKRYLLTNYHYRPKHPIPYKEEDLDGIGKLIHAVKVEGAAILGIYETISKESGTAIRCVGLNDYLKRDHLLGYR